MKTKAMKKCNLSLLMPLMAVIILLSPNLTFATFFEIEDLKYMWDDETGLVWYSNLYEINAATDVEPGYVAQDISLLSGYYDIAVDVNGDGFDETLGWRMAYSEEVLSLLDQTESDEDWFGLNVSGDIYSGDPVIVGITDYGTYLGIESVLGGDYIRDSALRENYISRQTDPAYTGGYVLSNNAIDFAIVADVQSWGGPAPAPVPEPATVLLLGTGLVAIAGMGRKKIKV